MPNRGPSLPPVRRGNPASLPPANQARTATGTPARPAIASEPTNPQVARNQSNNARARHLPAASSSASGSSGRPDQESGTGFDLAHYQRVFAVHVVRSINEANTSGNVMYEHHAKEIDPAGWRDDYVGGHANERYFIKNGPMNWTIRAGVSASKAIKSWLAGPTIAECGTVVVASHLNALRKELGDTNFDRVFGSRDHSVEPVVRLTISGDHQECMPSHFFKHHRLDGEAQVLIPGARYYFKNHDHYLYRHPDGAIQGNNVVYVGEHAQRGPIWGGFGMANMTRNELLNSLRANYDAKRTEEDYQAIIHNPTTNIPPQTLANMEARGLSYEAIYQQFSTQRGYINNYFLDAEHLMSDQAFFQGDGAAALDNDVVALDVENIRKFRGLMEQ